MENNVAVSEEVHVLAVDDSLVDRKVIERLLKISSCKVCGNVGVEDLFLLLLFVGLRKIAVTAVESGIRALQYLGLDDQRRTSESDGFVQIKVDLIITDYCMPEMTGYELLKKIKESSTFREIPVVIMSSENVLPRIDRCLEEGAEDFIVKPVKLSDVKRLKNYMTTTRDVRGGGHDGRYGGDDAGGGGGINKRKLSETSDVSSSPPSVFQTITSSSPYDSSPSRSPSFSPSSSPSVLDSPIRRLKMTSAD